MKAVRRWSVVGTVLVLGVGLAQLPTPARAATPAGALELSASLSVPSGCARTIWPGTARIALPADRKVRQGAIDRVGVASSSKAHATGLARGQLGVNSWGSRILVLRASAAVSLRPQSASPCSAVGFSETTVAVNDVDVPKKSWLVVSSKGSRTGDVVSAAIGAEAVTGPDVSVLVAPGRSATRLVAPGSYLMGSTVRVRASVPAQSTTSRVSGAESVGTVAFYPIGTLRTSSGTGRAYVEAEHRSCRYNRVRVVLHSAARTKARKITFYVNGVARRVLTGSGLQRSALYLDRIAPASAGSIRAVVKTTSGETRTMNATSWPCA